MTKLLENSLGYFQTCQIGNSKSRVGLLSLLEEKENYSMEEVFGDIDNELFTLEEALSYLEITESEFKRITYFRWTLCCRRIQKESKIQS